MRSSIWFLFFEWETEDKRHFSDYKSHLSCCSAVAPSCPTLPPHGLQRTRLPCSSPSPRIYSNSCPLSRWCHPTSCPLSSPSPPTFNLSQLQGLFQWVSSFHQVAKVLEFQLRHQSFQLTFWVDFLSHWLFWSPLSPSDSQESSPTPRFKGINSLALSLLSVSCVKIKIWLRLSPDHTFTWALLSAQQLIS